MAKSQLQSELKQRIRQARFPFHPDYTCTWCYRKMDPPGTISLVEATKDHPQPRVHGGGGVVVWACWTCNQIKYDMPYEAWKLYMSMHPRWWDAPHARTLPRIKKQEDETNIVPIRKQMTELKLITGGQPPITGNWLMDLPVGTMFTVKAKKQDNFMGLDLKLVGKTDNTVVLYELSTGQPFGGNGRIIPHRFVNTFDFVEKLPSYEEMLESLPQEETVENKDGDSQA